MCYNFESYSLSAIYYLSALSANYNVAAIVSCLNGLDIKFSVGSVFSPENRVVFIFRCAAKI